MDTTGRYELPLLIPSQAQKHVTHNEALTLLDALVHPAINTFGDAAPPPAVQIDDAFFVGPSATGDWFGQSGKIAVFTGMGWRFAAVREGMMALDLGAGQYVVFDGSAWQPLGDRLSVSSLPQLGVNTAADSSNKLSVRSNAALLNALDTAGGGTGDIRLTLNKEAAADTASLVFQSGFSGRAEFGITGDDDFRIKVSANGSAWTDAITVNRTSGQVTLANNSVGNAALADMAGGTIKGRSSAGTGDPQDLTATQATALLDSFTSAAKGLAPASGGGTANFLRADGDWASPSPADGSASGPVRYFAFHDCMSPVSNQYWTFTATGTGASHTTQAFAETNAVGAVRGNLGTVASNRVSIASPAFTGFSLGAGAARFAARMRFAGLSDATNGWTLRVGFIDSVTAEPADGAFLRYTHSVNGGRFQAVTRANNVETAVDTGVTPAAATTYVLDIVVNENATSVTFLVNGVTVATLAANIPVGAGRETGYGLAAIRSVGTAALSCYDAEFVMAEIQITTPRL